LRFVYLDESTESNVRIELVGQVADPEDECGLDEVVSLLRREISRIPPLLRKVMLLRDLDQLSMDEVAFQLGLSIPAAKSRLARARMELKSRVMKHCGQRSWHTDANGPVFPGSIYSRQLIALRFPSGSSWLTSDFFDIVAQEAKEQKRR
jgi:RNA polymerase sigma-70 factor (ECF subfamily)